jgi:aminoglycoside 2'-N-acetyltransferase I
VHALRFEGDRLVAHGALVARRFLHGGRSLRTGYVEALVVASDRQRRGHGAAVMTVLHRYIERAYALGALASSDVGAQLYLAQGWTRWTGPKAVLAPDGIRQTAAADDIFVRPITARLDPTLPLVCDWREGHVW